MITENIPQIPYVLFAARHLCGYDVTVFLEVVLHELGFSRRGYGRCYVKETVQIYCNDPKQLLVDGVYQQVANQVGPGCSKYQVEVTIRRAVHTAWKRRDAAVWALFFPGCEKTWSKAPSNSQFIAALAALVELWKTYRAKEVASCEENT